MALRMFLLSISSSDAARWLWACLSRALLTCSSSSQWAMPPGCTCTPTAEHSPHVCATVLCVRWVIRKTTNMKRNTGQYLNVQVFLVSYYMLHSQGYGSQGKFFLANHFQSMIWIVCLCLWLKHFFQDIFSEITSKKSDGSVDCPVWKPCEANDIVFSVNHII